MKWNDLTMKERSDLMSLFLKAGVSSLSDMKRIYEENTNLDNTSIHKYSGEDDNPGIWEDLTNWAKKKWNEVFSKNNTTTRFQRVLENDSPTKQLSEEWEDAANEAMKYSIPRDVQAKEWTPYIREKEIKIPSVGRASTNMLDSLAKYSAVVGLPISDAIGLAARETKFGAQPYTFTGYPSEYSSFDKYKENERAVMNMSYARNFGGVPSAYLLNDEAWYDYNSTPKAMKNFVSKTGSPFEHALYYFKTGNYNNGEKGYNSTVKQLGKTIFNTPIIQQWWKDSEYNPRNTGKTIKHSDGGYLFSGKENTVPKNNWNTGYLYNGPTSENTSLQPAPTNYVEVASESKQPDIFKYIVKRGDNLSVIAKRRGTTVKDIAKANNIKDVNKIWEGQELILPTNIIEKNVAKGTKETSKTSIKDIWAKEEELNKDNVSAIQGFNHTQNYVIIDKKAGKLKVFDKYNKQLYEAPVKTGESANDYNTITYTDSSGRIRNKQGNNSTPAGITEITSVGEYHGVPSFQRGRYNKQTGKFDDNIASSFHYGNVNQIHGSNGCVNIGPEDLKKLQNYIGKGTKVYTLPEQEGSRFKLSEGQLNYVADNPYGNDEKDNPKRFWDDYNVYSDKEYQPVNFEYTGKRNQELDSYHRMLSFNHGESDSFENNFEKTLTNKYSENVDKYLKALGDNKKDIMSKFGLSSETYNKLALLAAGIAQQESKFGTSGRKMFKDAAPDWVVSLFKTLTRGERGSKNRSYGVTQMKILSDNNGMRKIYQDNVITPESLSDVSTAAKATMLRLAYMYNTEVRGRNFKNNKGESISPYDALLYKWNGNNQKLKDGTATPEDNIYIKNVKKFANNVNLYQ